MGEERIASPWCEEPDALIAHVRICGGLGMATPSSTRPFDSGDVWAELAQPDFNGGLIKAPAQMRELSCDG